MASAAFGGRGWVVGVASAGFGGGDWVVGVVLQFWGGGGFMDAILIHGMGRSPLAMIFLGLRLWAVGIRPHFFGYSVTFERWGDCLGRYEEFIRRRVGSRDYIIVGHSLGTVLTRVCLPRLGHKPLGCFFLAPPTRVCGAARNFALRFGIRSFLGEIGRSLADAGFMESLPVPDVPTKIYAGVAGPRGRFSPFGDEPNDGLLLVEETLLPGVPVLTVPALHTFIMNSGVVTRDIVSVVRLGLG